MHFEIGMNADDVPHGPTLPKARPWGKLGIVGKIDAAPENGKVIVNSILTFPGSGVLA
jgi:hypothetical protein